MAPQKRRPKRTSAARIAANRRNAKKSTGPKTDAGKSISSKNARKHGILARAVVINTGVAKENRREFKALLNQLHEELEPVGLIEETLVERIAICHWRLRRAIRAESEATRANHNWTQKDVTLPAESNMDSILRYETAIERQLHRAIKELERLRENRTKRLEAPVAQTALNPEL